MTVVSDNRKQDLAELKDLKIAIVHEWLVNFAGSERVVEQMLELFPQADVFSLVDFLPESGRQFIKDKKVHTSFIQKLPFARKHFRNYFFLFPLAVEGHDLRGYDLILSSSHMVSKGAIINQNQLHLSYCHSPCRYAWDLYHQYLEEAGLSRGLKGFLAQWFLHKIRIWDQISTPRVHHFMANSRYIARRIAHVYRREAEVVYPPVDVQRFAPVEERDDYYLAASRLVPYKKMDLIAEAFASMPDKKLILLGSGRAAEEARVKKWLRPNIEFRKEAEAAEFLKLMSRARAFVFAAEEDFGITMAEAQACGTPVIAFAKGGAAEIISDGETGILFSEQSAESLKIAVEKFEKDGISGNAESISESAKRFSKLAFRDNLVKSVAAKWREFKA
jgi:glycosyltransferase involved in cell wall biosynthesis